jgi:hypothetical protein
VIIYRLGLLWDHHLKIAILRDGSVIAILRIAILREAQKIPFRNRHSEGVGKIGSSQIAILREGSVIAILREGLRRIT